MTPVSSWGRLSNDPHDVVFLSTSKKINLDVFNTLGIPHGMGRSYGDVCLNSRGRIWNTTQLNHFISFDEDTGLLVCESGVLLRDIQDIFIPRGWMLPVTPGTQFVTVGGAIANDVHGKNHHMMGAFGNHVQSFLLMKTSGEIIECRWDSDTKGEFEAAIGGLGLTGIILTAEIQLRKIPGACLESETIAYEHLEDFFDLADSSEAAWENTVSWVDCAFKKHHRGLFMRANFISDKLPERKAKIKKIPFTPPVSLINSYSLQWFNQLYFSLGQRKKGRVITDYASFFYPLDNLLEWNKIYGPKGFFQYQSVVPFESGKLAIQLMLKEINRSGEGSFLSVLKTFGHIQSRGMLSFPCPGLTLALDFPNKGARTLKLFERLDAIVREAKGKIYPAKDARMPRDLFESGYPRLSEFLKYRDPGISSELSRRLMGK